MTTWPSDSVCTNLIEKSYMILRIGYDYLIAGLCFHQLNSQTDQQTWASVTSVWKRCDIETKSNNRNRHKSQYLWMQTASTNFYNQTTTYSSTTYGMSTRGHRHAHTRVHTRTHAHSWLRRTRLALQYNESVRQVKWLVSGCAMICVYLRCACVHVSIKCVWACECVCVCTLCLYEWTNLQCMYAY